MACFKRFDDLIMRPWLILNYNEILIERKNEFMELFMKEGELWEKLYMHESEEISDYRTQRGLSFMHHLGSVAGKSMIRTNTLVHSNLTNIESLKYSTNTIDAKRINTPKINMLRKEL